jgi:hypothetical protein
MKKMTKVKCDLVLDDEQFDKYTDFLAWLKKDKEQKKKECPKSPTGKHEFVLPPDSFDNPYCKYCYKGS